MMKCYLAIVVGLLPFFCCKVKAQKDTLVVYYDSSLHTTKRANAFYGKAIVRQGNMYLVALVSMQDGGTVYTGSFADRALTIQEGLFEFYTGTKETMRGYYHEGKQVATWKQWDTTGLLLDSVGFDGEGEVLAEAKYSYHANKTLWRYVLKTALNQKTSKEYDTLQNLVSSGVFTGGDGESYQYYPNGSIKMHAVFKNSVRTLFEFFDETGKKYDENGYAELIKSKH